jgi:hypothetical protein
MPLIVGYFIDMAFAINRFQVVLRPSLCAVALGGALTLVGACSDGDDDDDNDSAAGNIVLTDANNYESVSVLTIPTVEVQPTDIEVCWDGVTTDIQCHDVDPVEVVDTVALLRFEGYSESDIEGLFGSGVLTMGDVDAYFNYETDHSATCVNISEMDLFGSQISVADDFVENDDFTYVILAARGTTPGVGTRSMTFVKPTAAATATSVQVPQGCTADAQILDFTADLSQMEAVEVPAGGPWVLDWSGVSNDSQGQGVAYERIDSLLLGFYEGLTVADIQDQVMDLELIATTLWELDLDDVTSADLAEARERNADGSTGSAFSGFETGTDGTWLVGLMCSQCQNPAPVILSILEPVGS